MNDEELGGVWTTLQPTVRQRRRIDARVVRVARGTRHAACGRVVRTLQGRAVLRGRSCRGERGLDRHRATARLARACADVSGVSASNRLDRGDATRRRPSRPSCPPAAGTPRSSLEIGLGRVFFLAVRETAGRVGEHHHRRHDAAHLDGIVERSGREARCVAGHLLHGFGAELDQPRVEPARIDAPHVPPLHGHAVAFGGAAATSRASARALLQRLGLERPLIKRNLAHAGHRGDNPRLDRHSSDSAHHAGVRRGMAPGDLAACERRLGGGKKRVTAHRDRRRPRMCGLADEAQDVPLDTVGTDDDARRTAPSPRARAPARCAARGRRAASPPSSARRASGMRSSVDSVLAQRIDQPHALFDRRRPRTLSGTRLPLAPDDPSRLREKRAPSSSAKSTTASVTGGVSALQRRNASTPARTPSAPSSQPPFGTESRWPPMMTVPAARREA